MLSAYYNFVYFTCITAETSGIMINLDLGFYERKTDWLELWQSTQQGEYEIYHSL